MRTIIGLILLAFVGAAAAAIRPDAAPSATSLLRAETLADQAQRRLKLPASRGPGWRRGGGGWSGSGARGGSHEEDGPPIRIEIRPSRAR